MPVIGIWVGVETYDQVKRLAEQNHCSMSSVIKRIVMPHLDLLPPGEKTKPESIERESTPKKEKVYGGDWPAAP